MQSAVPHHQVLEAFDQPGELFQLGLHVVGPALGEEVFDAVSLLAVTEASHKGSVGRVVCVEVYSGGFGVGYGVECCYQGLSELVPSSQGG